MRAKLAVAAIGALAVVASMGACSKNTGTDSPTGNDHVSKQRGGIATNPEDSQGPAPAVPGARKGGTLHVLQEDDYEHLDSQRTYVVKAMAIEQMFSRQLTTFVQDKDGNLLLVGDLATGPGKDLDGDKCMNWQYTLKKGLKYEDGSPITAEDVAYGISRSFSPNISEGPHYIAQWLADSSDYNADYKGPYNGGKKLAPGLRVKGDRVLQLHFDSPHCDLPFAMQMGTSTPVPQSEDKGQKYDLRPFSSGPYKIDKYTKGTKLTLVRNKYWDPKTDPKRHAYPDKIDVTFGASDATQTRRMIADQGEDKYGVQQTNVPQALIPQVQGKEKLKSRTVAGQTPFVYYLAINTQHIKDLKVRRAIAYSVNRKALIQTLGGPALGTPATTLLSPTVIGWKDYDAYPGGKTGNPKKAKKLLDGKHPKIVYGYRNDAKGQREAPKIQSALERAGFKVVLKPVDPTNYFTELGRKNNPFDLYLTDWAADWPTGGAVLPVLCDGRTIHKQGNNDVSYFNSDSYNKKLDEAAKLPADKSGPAWAKLDKEWVSKYSTVVPMYYAKGLSLNGSKVGGVKMSAYLGTDVFVDAYLKK